MKHLLALALLAASSPGAAQLSSIPVPVDLTATNAAIQAAQSKADAAKASADATAAAMPVPATSVPPAETVGGGAGSAGTYRPGNSIQPRITRAKKCVLAAGVCTVIYEALAADDPNVIPVANGTQPIFCAKTVAATTTTASIKCWMYQTALLSLAIVTTGITLGPQVAPDGTTVDVTVLPKN